MGLLHTLYEKSNVSNYGCTVILLDLGQFFSFLILYTIDRTPWMRHKPVARPLPTHRTTQTQNKRTHTFMLRVRFERTIPSFERLKRVYALDHVAAMIDTSNLIYVRSRIREIIYCNFFASPLAKLQQNLL
jgi:hypothetical protein